MPKTKQFRREKVLEAASEIFHKKGYNGTSIDEILKVTGLSRSSLYDSFNDKHSLYLESLEFYKTREQNGYEAIGQKHLNGVDKIRYVFTEVVKHLASHPDDNGCLMVNAAAEMSKLCPKTSQVVCNNKENVEFLFTEWLKEAEMTRPVKFNKPAAEYSSFLFNTLCGLKVMSQSGANRAELENVVKVTLDALN
jgi:TetR/AcrR family transcriptional regulator, transcriptional repressor for nem operon